MLSAIFDRITRLSMRFRWVTLAITGVILVLGVLAMTQLNLELTPRVEFPQTVVVVQWSDAENAQQFAEEVTIPLEEAFSAIDGVVNIESTTNPGFAFIIVRNGFGEDQDAVFDNIESAIADAPLPDSIESSVLNFSLSDLPVVVASVSSSSMDLAGLKTLVEGGIQTQLADLEDVSQVQISGGQELPDDTAVADTMETADPVTTAEAEQPGRLPLVVIEGAKALGLEIEYAQDVTPELLAGIEGTNDQVLAVLRLIPPDVLRYAPVETLAILPSEYMDGLDPALLAELNEIAADLGGVSQYNMEQARAILDGADPADVMAVTEPTPSPTAEPEITETVAETPELPEVTAVALPEAWVQGAAAMGQTVADTSDVTRELMEGIVGFAPEQLAALTPDMWRAIDPEVTALALTAAAAAFEPTLLAELQAIQLAATGVAPEPVALPESWVTMAGAAGFPIETTADIPAAAIGQLTTLAPDLLADVTPELLWAMAPDVLAELPQDYLTTLDEGVQQTLANVVIHAERYRLFAAAEMDAMAEGPQLEPVALPETWIAGAAQMGMTLATTADITPEVMGGIVGLAPELIAELSPEMWRAFDPAVTAVVLADVAATLDTDLLIQLEAIQLAANGESGGPVALPETWIQAAGAAGMQLETTADITPEVMGGIAGLAPELLAELTPEMLLALSPDALAELPAEYASSLDAGLQQTLTNMAIVQAQYAASQMDEGDAVVIVEPEPVDPARLPDLLIQGAESFGMTLEFAQDLTPEIVRPLAAAGPQAAQFFGLLTPDNLRLLPAESIALMPESFLETLDADLRAELDELAADFGGAGQLAVLEAAEREAASAGAPPLTGVWELEGPNGEAPMFTTAADFLNNPFTPNAVSLLNTLPAQSEDPVNSIGDLTTDVIVYLVDNEEDFLENLQLPFLELLSPAVILDLMAMYPDTFAPDIADRLMGIAAGDVEVFIPDSSITRTDGNPAVIISVFKDGDANTVEVAHRVFDVLAEYEESNPELTTSLVFEQATFIEDSIEGVSREGALGAVFAILVILLFLSGRVGGKYKLSWRATLVTAVSIPLSIFTAFLLMRWLPSTVGVWVNNAAHSSDNVLLDFISRLFPTNVTLNIMTLSGLTVAIGRVVDDSIVVLENSYRYIQRGDEPWDAVLAGTREVAIAIFSATVTTMAVFLPLGLVGGIIGSFFLPFGLTVTYALAASFVVSITVVPAMTYLLIRKENIPEEKETTMQRWYTPALEWSLSHRFVTMIVATVIFLASLFLLGQLPQSFIPGFGEPTVNVGVGLPQGTQMIETNELVERFEAVAQDLPGIAAIQTEIGSGGGLEAMFGGGGVSQNRASVTISVEDLDNLKALTNDVREEAEAVFGKDNVTVSAATQTGFSGFGLIVTGESLAQLQPYVEDIKGALASVDLDGDGIQDIANISSNMDNMVGDGSDTIIRVDSRPAISFGGELETDNTLGATNSAEEAIRSLDLPAGVEVTKGFDSEQQEEGFQGMITAIGYSIIIVYLIMALTFRSLIHPFTILFSLPFALVGAALALYLTNSVLGISAMIGFMMLVGVVVTNGIVLMELVQQLKNRGSETRSALVEAGRTRLRPIWMTALTAILALIPLAASNEAGAIIASELARAVMGGLIVSTALTLLVVPVVYSAIDQFAQWLVGFFRKA